MRISQNYASSGLSADSFSLVVFNGAGVLQRNFTNSFEWDGDSFLGSDGVFTTVMDTYQQIEVDMVEVNRSFTVSPRESFYLVEYSLRNPTSQPLRIRLLDYVVSGKGGQVSASYNEQEGLYVADETNAGSFFLASGVLNDSSISRLLSVGVSASDSGSLVSQFSRTFDISSQKSASASQVAMGSVVEVLLGGGASTTLTFFRTLQRTVSDCLAVSHRVRSKSPLQWKAQTAENNAHFLSSGVSPPLNGRLKTLYEHSVLNLKNSSVLLVFDKKLNLKFFLKKRQSPGIGAFVASFHPEYGMRSWARDGSFSAFIMDSAGYHQESEQFLQYLSKVPLRGDGAFQ